MAWPEYFSRQPLSDDELAALQSQQRESHRQAMKRADDVLQRLPQRMPWPYYEYEDPRVAQRNLRLEAAAGSGSLDRLPTTRPSAFREDASWLGGKLGGLAGDGAQYVFGALRRPVDAAIDAGRHLHDYDAYDPVTSTWRQLDPADPEDARLMAPDRRTSAGLPGSDLRPRPDRWSKAAEAAFGGLPGMVIPQFVPGRLGGERDWRVAGERLGLDPWNIVGADVLTDPLTYGASFGKYAKGLGGVRQRAPALVVDGGARVRAARQGDDVRNLYIRASQRYHPDVTGGSGEIQKAINLAFQQGDAAALRAILSGAQ